MHPIRYNQSPEDYQQMATISGQQLNAQRSSGLTALMQALAAMNSKPQAQPTSAEGQSNLQNYGQLTNPHNAEYLTGASGYSYQNPTLHQSSY